MPVFMSYDYAKSCPVQKLIDPDWANCSDLAVLEDKTILLLYAKGRGLTNIKWSVGDSMWNG